MTAEGLHNKTIAQNIDLSAAFVGMWRKRFIHFKLSTDPFFAKNVGGPQKVAPDKQLDALVAAIPMKRIGKPEEIADTVVFLASDDAS